MNKFATNPYCKRTSVKGLWSLMSWQAIRIIFRRSSSVSLSQSNTKEIKQWQQKTTHTMLLHIYCKITACKSRTVAASKSLRAISCGRYRVRNMCLSIILLYTLLEYKCSRDISHTQMYAHIVAIILS